MQEIENSIKKLVDFYGIDFWDPEDSRLKAFINAYPYYGDGKFLNDNDGKHKWLSREKNLNNFAEIFFEIKKAKSKGEKEFAEALEKYGITEKEFEDAGHMHWIFWIGRQVSGDQLLLSSEPIILEPILDLYREFGEDAAEILGTTKEELEEMFNMFRFDKVPPCVNNPQKWNFYENAVVELIPKK